MARKPLDQDLYDSVVAEAKRKFDVWPSAYASGWVVKTYKARGGRYAGGDKKTRTGLTKWFGESWVDLSRPIREDGEVVGYEPCGRKKSGDPADYPKCRPKREAMRMTPSEVRDAIKRKRAAEAKAAKGGRGGRGARAPVRVATYKQNPEELPPVVVEQTYAPEATQDSVEEWWQDDGDDLLEENPMRQPEDAPSFRFAVLEDGSDGRIVLEAYDGPETLAFITARPAKFARTKNRRTGVGVRASTLSDLTSPDPRQNVVWTVESVHAVPGWGPLMYEALLAFAALEGYSGWVTSDVMITSFEAERVWERFAKRDDVEFRAFVGRNSRGEKMHAARALPTLAAKRAGLFVG